MQENLGTANKKNPHQSWWKKAIVTSLTAWMFASIIAVILVILHAFDFESIRYLEQLGIDRGMQLYSDSASESAPHKYAFVDVDKDACKQFLDGDSDSDPECMTSKPVPTSLIIDFVRAAVESQAALIIIDVNLPEKNESLDRKTLTQELTLSSAQSDTWIIAPVYDRPSDSGSGLAINGNRQFDIIPNHAQGRLRIASAATYAEHGIIRVYPTASCYVTQEGERWIPTIPYLAALLIKNPEVAQLYYQDADKPRPIVMNQQQKCSQLEIPVDFFKRKVPSALVPFEPLDTTQIPPIIRFFYSIPSLGNLMSMRERDGLRIKHIYNYQYYEASKLIDSSPHCVHKHIDGFSKSPGCFRSQKEYYKGKIVVLGSSRAETMDHAQTPIGVMSGSELILNATRAFLEFKPLEQSPPFTMLMDKFKGIGIAMIPMFITWSLIFASEPITQKIRGNLINRFRNSRIKLLRFCHWQILNWFRMLFVIAIFILGIYIAYIFEVVYLWGQLKLGNPTDLFLPAFALGLQGFAVAAKIISAIFYRMAETFFDYLMRIFSRFFD